VAESDGLQMLADRIQVPAGNKTCRGFEDRPGSHHELAEMPGGHLAINLFGEIWS